MRGLQELGRAARRPASVESHPPPPSPAARSAAAGRRAGRRFTPSAAAGAAESSLVCFATRSGSSLIIEAGAESGLKIVTGRKV